MTVPTPLFAFDLDGTITRQEILPRIAAELGLEKELGLLTELTLKGHIPFEPSFRLRFSLLQNVPLGTVQEIVASIPLDPHIEAFIHARKHHCAVVTGNLDRWIAPLVQRLGCVCHCSRSRLSAQGQLQLLSVLNKGDAIQTLQADGCRVIAIGESVNDIPMFTHSHLGIAFAGVHAPAPELARLADHTVANGQDLCRLLQSLA